MGYKDPQAQKEYQRQWCRDRRTRYFNGQKCVGCDSEGPLELHHLSPKEKVHHAIWSWTETRLRAELAKCVLLCVPCHKAVTARQRRVEALERNPHGTRQRYDLGCKCDPCRRAKGDYNRAHPPKPRAA